VLSCKLTPQYAQWRPDHARKRVRPLTKLRVPRPVPVQCKTLLLTARKRHSGTKQTVLYLIPQSSSGQRLLNDLIETASFSKSVDANSITDVVINRHWKRVRPLKDHTYTATQPRVSHTR